MAPAIRKADGDGVRAAAECLRRGGLVAFGTETVYGLGGNALDGAAVARIFAAKNRPRFNPLICHLPDRDAAFALAEATESARVLARHFWPGPMTLILDKAATCPVHELCLAGLPGIALRVPGADVAREFLGAAGVPVAAPSANRSGRISPTCAEHVAEEFGDAAVEMILDCGACVGGIESTVIDARGERPRILRPGSITAEMIFDKTGLHVDQSDDDDGAIISPGQMVSHYAPRTPLVINAESAGESDVWIGFGDAPPPPQCKAVFNLSRDGNLIAAAANLYAMLREADAMDGARIVVAAIPMIGIGVAINDRLSRASSKKDSV